MAFELPKDINENKFFGKKTEDNEHAYMPTVIVGPDGKTPISEVNKFPVADTAAHQKLDAVVNEQQALKNQLAGIIDGSTPATSQLTGSNIEKGVVEYFVAEQIRDTTTRRVNKNTSKYRPLTFYARNTLDSEVELWFSLGMIYGDKGLQYWDGEQFVRGYNKKVVLPANTDDYIVINSIETYLDYIETTKLQVNLYASSTPTSGDLTIFAIGQNN
ncbi:hypothetical protein [Halobacillus salinus]|uniref:Uncharacterized protein n=1 Tax=Halobacillus salinus TaxID=192814 RepID=A0A4Z0H676_9BACI|nr:hypothetical protein [Halobacillus salinus]TGB04686.1 hypothetical protein E4663_06760 [Halobacillus salinus]